MSANGGGDGGCGNFLSLCMCGKFRIKYHARRDTITTITATITTRGLTNDHPPWSRPNNPGGLPSVCNVSMILREDIVLVVYVAEYHVSVYL